MSDIKIFKIYIGFIQAWSANRRDAGCPDCQFAAQPPEISYALNDEMIFNISSHLETLLECPGVSAD